MLTRLFRTIKRTLYFPGAFYFRVFAQLRLRRWNPRVIVVTGSSGKTTLLHLIEAQLGPRARYSHRANSAYGIPFDILGMRRERLTPDEWLFLAFGAPLRAFAPLPRERFYVVEADCDRPYEGQFLASLLNPEVTLWTGVSKSHSGNFEAAAARTKTEDVESVIAGEFGNFARAATKLTVINGDDAHSARETTGIRATVRSVRTGEQLTRYAVRRTGTEFTIDGVPYAFPYLLPRESFYGVAMCRILVEYLGIPFDPAFKHLRMPPGRSSLFHGVRGTTIVDSSYNANLSSMTAALEMFRALPENRKWIVLGDMIEQGSEERPEHEKLAAVVARTGAERIVLVGPRLGQYTYPKLEALGTTNVARFEQPKDALAYLRSHLQGGEVVLFKGARFLEGIIEQLLENKSDASLLCRREEIWQQRRKQWGF